MNLQANWLALHQKLDAADLSSFTTEKKAHDRAHYAFEKTAGFGLPEV